MKIGTALLSGEKIAAIAFSLYVIQFGNFYKNLFVQDLILFAFFSLNLLAISKAVYTKTYIVFLTVIFISFIPQFFILPETLDPISGYTSILQYTFLFVVAVPSFNYVYSGKNKDFLVKSIILAGVVAIVIAFIFLFAEAFGGGMRGLGSSFAMIPIGKEGNISFGGRYAIGNVNMHAILLCGCLVLAQVDKKILGRASNIIIAILLLGIAITFSRGAYMFVAVFEILSLASCSFFVWKGRVADSRKVIKDTVISTVTITAIVVALGSMLFFSEDILSVTALDRIVDVQSSNRGDASIGGRTYLAQMTIDHIDQSSQTIEFLFGIGINQSQELFKVGIPHILVLLWFLELGLLSTLLVAAATILIVVLSLRDWEGDNGANLMRVAGFVSFLVWTLSSTHIFGRGFAIFFALLIVGRLQQDIISRKNTSPHPS